MTHNEFFNIIVKEHGFFEDVPEESYINNELDCAVIIRTNSNWGVDYIIKVGGVNNNGLSKRYIAYSVDAMYEKLSQEFPIVFRDGKINIILNDA